MGPWPPLWDPIGGCGLAMADIDFSKAYDIVDRFVKEFALRRMGVGYELIDYLLGYDRMNVQHVRTSLIWRQWCLARLGNDGETTTTGMTGVAKGAQ